MTALEQNHQQTFHGAQVVDWMEEAYLVLKDSQWAPALDVEGVDMLEVLRAPIYTSLLRLARDKPYRASGHPISTKFRAVAKWGYLRSRMVAEEYKVKLLSQKPQSVSVVFWPREPTHIKVQIPVALFLGEIGIEYSFIACKPAIFEKLRAQRINAVFTRGAWSDLLRKARREGKRKSGFLLVEPEVALPAFPNPSESKQLVKILRETISEWLLVVHEAVASTNAIVDRISPDVLVIGNDITLEGRAASFQARLRGLPTVCLMHGAAFDPLHKFHIADKMLVYGETFRRQFVKLGMDSSRIAVTGAPYLDKRPQQTGKLHPTLQVRLNLHDDKPWVLVATSGPGHSISYSHHYAMIKSIMVLSAKLTDVSFVAKLHRKDRIEYYKQIQEMVPESRLTVVPHGALGFPNDIFDWLQGCSMVLTGASMVAMEAMLMEVPVVTIDLMRELRNIDFIDAGATWHVTNSEELHDALLTILRSEDDLANLKIKMSYFLTDYFYALDGRSAYRCADVIQDLIRKN